MWIESLFSCPASPGRSPYTMVCSKSHLLHRGTVPLLSADRHDYALWRIYPGDDRHNLLIKHTHVTDHQ
ncbi:hypothetical protein PAGL106935_15175 [Paenibacillus glucanolyticus]